jgi:hypothetical protein
MGPLGIGDGIGWNRKLMIKARIKLKLEEVQKRI